VKKNIMKKIYRWMYWFVFNGLFLAILWLGYNNDIKGLKNLALFITWFTIALSPLMLLAITHRYSEENIKDKSEKMLVIPFWLRIPYDILIVGIFVWYGAIITAVFYLLHAFLLALCQTIEMAYFMKNKTENKKT